MILHDSKPPKASKMALWPWKPTPLFPYMYTWITYKRCFPTTLVVSILSRWFQKNNPLGWTYVQWYIELWCISLGPNDIQRSSLNRGFWWEIWPRLFIMMNIHYLGACSLSKFIHQWREFTIWVLEKHVRPTTLICDN